MSIFRTYTPKRLWETTLRLVNAMFHTRPEFTSEPKSYFRAVLHAHNSIRQDLEGMLTINPPDVSNETTTVAHVYASLKSLESTLFGTQTEFPPTVEGCCKYTEYMEEQLGNRSTCDIV